MYQVQVTQDGINFNALGVYTLQQQANEECLKAMETFRFARVVDLSNPEPRQSRRSRNRQVGQQPSYTPAMQAARAANS